MILSAVIVQEGQGRCEHVITQLFFEAYGNSSTGNRVMNNSTVTLNTDSHEKSPKN